MQTHTHIGKYKTTNEQKDKQTNYNDGDNMSSFLLLTWNSIVSNQIIVI